MIDVWVNKLTLWKRTYHKELGSLRNLEFVE